MTPAISVAGLTRRYRGQVALDDVTFDVEGGSITGLLGRNGAGKTTFLRILAGHEFASAGRVAVLGASPAHDEVLRRMVFIREDQAYPDFWAWHALRVASWFYPDWDAGLARALVADFGLPVKRRIRKLSRGMRSALGIVIGLATRAEVTLFDEPYAGLDAVARQVFYDRMLADHTEHPRTVLLSTHLIDEAAGLLDRVVVIARGRVVLESAAGDLRESATSVSGPDLAVAEFTSGRAIWECDRIASREPVVVVGALDDADRARAQALHLSLEPLTLQVARYHLVDRISYVALPWGIMAFDLAVSLAIVAMVGDPAQTQVSTLASIYVVFFALGLLSMVRSLPFGLALGVSRRSYYAGTVFLAVSLAAVYGLALAGLQVIERATGGWGMTVHFFRVRYILDGPWYLSWLTSFVGLGLLFTYGVWFGLVYRRWNLIGLVAFIAAQVIVFLAGALVATWADAWPAIGDFLTTLSAAGLTGVLAGLAAALLAGGFITMRRVTV